MSRKSVIIIGAGLAGLSAGCYAQMNGYDTHIFEHHSQAGGVAAAWKRGNYLIDGGIHFLMGHRPGQPLYKMYQELGTAQVNRFLDMTTYGHFLDEASGRSMEVTSDLERLAADLKALSPADARVANELIAGARAMQGASMSEMGLGRPPELTGFLDQLREMWDMRRLFKYFIGKYNKPIADYVQTVQDPWLRQLLQNLFLPEVPVWFIFMLLGLLADRQVGLLEGGSLDFVRPIAQRYKDLGGQITCRATVEEILVRDDRAVGIRLAGGGEHHADVVVSAADGYSTIFKMLGGRYVDKKIEERYKTWKLIRPVVMVSLGAAREFTGEPWLRMIMLEQPFTVGNQAIEAITVRIFNYSPRFAPPGKAVVQVMFETEWHFWNELQTDRPRYEAEKMRVAEEVLTRLEAHYPGLSSQVEVTDVATPYTTWRYTLNHKGAYMGWLPTPEIIMTTIKRTLPGLENFYMAGQWVTPGGGVPTSLYTGRHVAQILCHRDGKPFVTTVP